MTTGPGVAKVCMFCGEDCSQRPRTRDARGRYFCTTCYDEAARQRRAQRGHDAGSTPTELAAGETPPDPQPLPRAEAAVSDALPFALHAGENLLEEIISAPPIVAPPIAQAPCSQCGHPVAAQAILCIHCGYNQQTRRKFKVRGGRAHHAFKMRGGRNRAIDTSTSTLLTVPFDLFFRPARFFRTIGAEPSTLLVLVAMFIYAAVLTLNRVQARIGLADALGRIQVNVDSWAFVSGVACVGGAVGGLLIWFIHGWWYRIRIGWSGAPQDDSLEARPVFAMTTLVMSLPALVYYLILANSYDAPRTAFTSDMSLLDAVPPLFLFWSLWTSYAAVRTVFDTRPVLTLVWFVLVPGVWFLISIGVAVGMAAAAGALAGALPQPPDLRSPQSHNNEVLGFNYPGNWTIDTTHPDHDPYSQLWIASADGACGVSISFYQAINTPEEELQATMRDLRRALQGGRTGESFAQWGGFSGHGSVIVGRTPEGLFKHRVFVTEAPPGWILEIVEIVDPRAEAWNEPGLQLIRDDFREPTPQQLPRRR